MPVVNYLVNKKNMPWTATPPTQASHFPFQERECTDVDGWLEPGTSEKIRMVLTNCLVELFKKQKKTTTEASDTTFWTDEPVEEIEEEEATFLDTLMDDNDIEAYDLLDDDF